MNEDLSNVLTLQSIIRCKLIVKDMKQSLMGCIVIESKARNTLMRNQMRDELKSLVILQGLIRHYQTVSKKLNDVKDLVTLQSISKQFIEKQRMSNSIDSIRCIQSVIRQCNIKVNRVKEIDRIKSLQSASRKLIAKRNVEKSIYSTSLIAGFARGILMRRMKSNDISNLITTQCQIRRKKELEIKRKELSNILHLESLIKKMLTIKEVKVQKERILDLQSLIKRFLTSKLLNEQSTRVITLQSIIRGNEKRTNYVLVCKAITSIQSAIRSKLERSKMGSQRLQTIIMESKIRGLLERKSVRSKLIQCSCLQSICRKYLSTEYMRKLSASIIKLQAIERGKQEKDILYSSINRVIVLQSIIRGYLISKEICGDLNKIIDFESLSRTEIKRRELNIELIRHNILIAIIRKYLQINAIENDLNNCTLLESYIKGSLTRKHLNKNKESVTYLQAACRTTPVKKQFTLSKERIISIQSLIRGRLNKKNFKDNLINLKSRLVLLQGLIRAFLYKRHDLMYPKITSPTTPYVVPPTYELLQKLHEEKDEDIISNVNSTMISPVSPIFEPVSPLSAFEIISHTQPLFSAELTKLMSHSASTSDLTTPPKVNPIHKRETSDTSLKTKYNIDVTCAIEDCKQTKSEVLDLSGLNLETLPYATIDCSHVKVLKLNNNNLTSLPSWFCDTFKNVTDLDLSGNQLIELPYEISTLPLKNLDISKNKFEYLPIGVTETSTLQNLNVSNNVLLHLPSVSQLSNLEQMDISNNYLMTLPEDLKKIKNLKKFSFEGNQFLQSEISKIAEICCTLSGEKNRAKFIKKFKEQSGSALGYSETTAKHLPSDPLLTPNRSYDHFDTTRATEMYDSDFDEEMYTMTDSSSLDNSPQQEHIIVNHYMSDSSDGSDTLEPTTNEIKTKYQPPIPIPIIKLTELEKLSPSLSLDSPTTKSPLLPRNLHNESSSISPSTSTSVEERKQNLDILTGFVKSAKERRLSQSVDQTHSSERTKRQSRLTAFRKGRSSSSPLTPRGSSSKEDKSAEEEIKEKEAVKERVNILLEILESERKYVNYLDTLWELFYEPIVNGRYNPGYEPPKKKTVDQSSTIIDQKEERLVPENIAKTILPSDLLTIRTFNKNFLAQLEERFTIYKDNLCGMYEMRIGDLFVKMAPFLKIYITYLSSYENCMTKIREYRKENKEFDRWIDRRKKHPKSCGLEMQSFLVMPVQRTPRYRLLLENLLKHTPQQHADYDTILQAIDKISDCATDQNVKIKETNNRMKIHQLSKVMKLNDLVQPHRRLIREGEIIFAETPKIVYRAYLFNDIFLFREKKRQKLKVKKTIKVYSLWNAYISSGSKDKITICLYHPDKQKMIEKEIIFPDQKSKSDWALDIEKTIEEVKEKKDLFKEEKVLLSPTSKGLKFLRFFMPKRNSISLSGSISNRSITSSSASQSTSSSSDFTISSVITNNNTSSTSTEEKSERRKSILDKLFKKKE